jgi:glycosyltransferase involved in cell wall biosynthesis
MITVTYSIYWADLVPHYYHLLLTSEPYDWLVVPSRAAEVAVRNICAWLDDTYQVTLRAEIVRIPFGVETDRYALTERATCRGLLGLPADAGVLLYFGRLTSDYKADLLPLLIAFAGVRSEHYGARLVIAGHNQENYSARLRGDAHALGISAAVTVLDDPSEAVKHLLYGAADIYVLPADNIQESFGLTVLEAMAHGLPVVASDWSGFRDIVVDGVTGFLVPCWWDPQTAEEMDLLGPLCWSSYGPASEMAQGTIIDVEGLRACLALLLTDRDLRLRMGAAGRERVIAEFGMQAVIRRYQALLANSRPPDMKRRPGSLLSMNRTFQHYASACLDDNTVVETAINRLSRIAFQEPRSGDPKEGELVSRIMTEAAGGREIGYWQDKRERRVVLKLLKLGHLTIRVSARAGSQSPERDSVPYE